MWVMIVCLILSAAAVATIWLVIDKVNRFAKHTDRVLDNLRRKELSPLQQRIEKIESTLESYQDLRGQVAALKEIYYEIRAEAESFQNPLEIVARKRRPR